MVNAKKKKSTKASSKPVRRSGVSGTKVHARRAKSSGNVGLSDRDRRIFAISRKVIFGVIVIAMLAVILAVLASIFNNPESLVKNKIESITADYYENYFYSRIENYGTTDKSLADIMSRYTETGFSKITLRQLLLFDSERYGSVADYLTGYCDQEDTYVKIYPEEPFSKSDYRVDYHYACTF